MPIAHAKRGRNLFILDLATPEKIMQTNVTPGEHAMMTTRRERPQHLVSHSKKVRIWYRRFGYASNAQIIRASKLLAGIGEFSTTYDPAKIYSNSEASEPEDVNVNIEPELHATLQASRVTYSGSDFDEIYELCVGSKQTCVVRQQKPLTQAKDKLEVVHVNL